MCESPRKWLTHFARARMHDAMPSLVRIVSPTKNPLPLVISKVGALLAVTLACKVHRLVIGYAHTTVGGKVASIALDLSFLLSYAAVWLWILLRPGFGPFLGGSFRVATTTLIICALCDHGFFFRRGQPSIGTSSNMPWCTLAKLFPLLTHEGRKFALTITFIVGFALLPKAAGSLPWLTKARTLVPAPPVGRRGFLVTLTCVALLAPTGIILSTASASSLDLASHNVYLRLGVGAVRDLRRARKGVLASVGSPAETRRLSETRSDRHFNVVLVIFESARARSFAP